MQLPAHRGGDGMSGHDGDGEPQPAFDEVAEQREAVHHRHLEVGEHHVHVLRVQELQGVPAVLGGNDRERPSAVQGPCQGAPHEGVVVDEQQGLDHDLYWGAGAVRASQRLPTGSTAS